MQERSAFNPALVREKLLVTIAVAVIVTTLFIVFSGDDLRPLFSNWTINISAGTALTMALVASLRQGTGGLYGRTTVAFTAGLALWFAAELLWTYYELGTGIEVPYPSPADALWMAGYGPMAYHLLKTYRFFAASRKALAATVAVTSAFVVYTCMVIIGASSPGVEGPIALVLSLAYVVLDGILLAPSILLLANFRKGKLTLTPWALLSASLAMAAVADAGFAYYTAAGLDGLIWHWDPLYNASYIIMAATFFWHNRFFIFDKSRAKKIWQQDNR
nr:hypothetical protein [uncultured Nitrososphaera sp.]